MVKYLFYLQSRWQAGGKNGPYCTCCSQQIRKQNLAKLASTPSFHIWPGVAGCGPFAIGRSSYRTRRVFFMPGAGWPGGRPKAGCVGNTENAFVEPLRESRAPVHLPGCARRSRGTCIEPICWFTRKATKQKLRENKPKPRNKQQTTVGRTLGKGEAESSILSCGTMKIYSKSMSEIASASRNSFAGVRSQVPRTCRSRYLGRIPTRNVAQRSRFGPPLLSALSSWPMQHSPCQLKIGFAMQPGPPAPWSAACDLLPIECNVLPQPSHAVRSPIYSSTPGVMAYSYRP